MMRTDAPSGGDANLDTGAPERSSPLGMYLRVLPVVLLIQVGWLVIADEVLRPEEDTPAMTWGFRTIQSGTSDEAEDELVRTYAEAAERVKTYIAEQGDELADGGKAQRTAEAYEWLDGRTFLGLAILGIASILLVMTAARGDLAPRARAQTLLCGGIGILTGLLWFRWYFGEVSGDIAYAEHYGFTTTATFTLFLAGLAALLGAITLLLPERDAA